MLWKWSWKAFGIARRQVCAPCWFPVAHGVLALPFAWNVWAERREYSRIEVSCILLVDCVCISKYITSIKRLAFNSIPRVIEWQVWNHFVLWKLGVGREHERNRRKRQPSSQRLKEFLFLAEDVNLVILSVERVLPFSNDEYSRSKITLSWASKQDSTLPLNPGYLEFHTDGPVICMWCIRTYIPRSRQWSKRG